MLLIAAGMMAGLVLLAGALTFPGIPDEEIEPILHRYGRRRDVDLHKRAARELAELASRYPGNRDLQLLAAMAAYYCAHRLRSSREQRETALRGVDCARRVLALDPKDYDGLFWQAMTTFKSRQAEGIPAALREARKAKAFLEGMIQERPDRFEARMLLGVLYRELPPFVSFGDKRKALELLEQAQALAPREPELLLELAAAYQKMKRRDDARRTYQRVLDASEAPLLREWETEDARDYARRMMRKL